MGRRVDTLFRLFFLDLKWVDSVGGQVWALRKKGIGRQQPGELELELGYRRQIQVDFRGARSAAGKACDLSGTANGVVLRSGGKESTGVD